MKRFFSWIKGFVLNRYEAAVQSWGERSWINAAVQDARFDADEATRTEIVRKSRYFERNNAIVNRLADLFEQFTVGSNGLQIIPDTSSEEYNGTASDWWSTWCQFPDLTSRQPFSVLQTLMARNWFIDGEIFIYKTYSKETNRPRIQLLESHLIKTPPDMREEEGKTIIDGIRINADGRPVAYYVRDGLNKDVYRLIPASQIIHLFEPSRPGMYRGLPFLYPVMNDLHDLDDLQILENKAAKESAKTTKVIKTATGETSSSGMRRQAMSIGSQTSTGAGTTKPDDQYYKNAFGGDVELLKKGDEYDQFVSQRPSVAVREYWDYLTSKVCAGVGISKLLVFPYSIQGTVTRADLDVATTFFRSRSTVIAAASMEIYIWVMGWATTYDQALDGYPEDWFKAVARPPRAPNVDVGRNSTAMLAELKAGTRTFQDIYAENGEDWRKQLRQKAEEAAYIDELAKEFKIKPEQIAMPNEVAVEQKQLAPATP